MKSQLILPAFLAMVLSAAGCQHHNAAIDQPSGTVTHVVLFWMKDPQDTAARKRLMDATESLRKIPGMMRLTYGRAIPSTRSVVDASFDLGIVMTFANRKALNAYEEHPIHAKAVQEVLLPLTKKVQVYDVERE
jgi:hypothetical protein